MEIQKEFFYLNEKNETIKVISFNETEVEAETKDFIVKIPKSQLRQIKLGEKAIKGLLIEKFPEPMAAVVKYPEPLPTRKNNNKWKNFVNESKAIKCSNSSNYLCYISDKFQNDNKIFYVDELQNYLLKEGLGFIIFENDLY